MREQAGRCRSGAVVRAADPAWRNARRGLLSLLNGERHGYALLKETEAPAEADSHDVRRRYYRATTFGRAVARAEAQRVHRLHDMLTRVPQLSPRRSGR